MDLYTHPGKLGDALWALATAVAHAQRPFDFAVSPYCMPLIPLLQSQPQIAHAYVLENWQILFDAPITPAKPPWVSNSYNRAYHLGMREWPTPTLAEYYPRLMLEEYGVVVKPDFDQPWLNRGKLHNDEIVISFSDEWVELKVGWIVALCKAFPMEHFVVMCPEKSRLHREFPLPFRNLKVHLSGILGLAEFIAYAKLVITCNSIGHPLSSALGKRTIIAEPSVPRQQAVFKAPIKLNTYFDGVNAYELVDLVKIAL